MARRSADERGEPKLLMVAPGPGEVAKRKRYVPVADLLAREGRPLEMSDEPFLAEAVASVRRGMTGFAAGLLVIAGIASIAEQTLLNDRDGAVSSGQNTEPAGQVPTSSSATTSSSITPAANKHRRDASDARDKSSERKTAPTTRAPRRTTAHQPAPAQQTTAPKQYYSPDWQQYVPEGTKEWSNPDSYSSGSGSGSGAYGGSGGYGSGSGGYGGYGGYGGSGGWGG